VFVFLCVYLLCVRFSRLCSIPTLSATCSL
jgi:hypothetical protein